MLIKHETRAGELYMLYVITDITIDINEPITFIADFR